MFKSVSFRKNFNQSFEIALIINVVSIEWKFPSLHVPNHVLNDIIINIEVVIDVLISQQRICEWNFVFMLHQFGEEDE